MAIWKRAPRPELAEFVEWIAFSSDEGELPGSPIRVLPDGCTDLLFSVEEPTASDPPSRPAVPRACTGAVFGTKTRALLVSNATPVENIAVVFRPGAAHRFVGIPAHELTDRAVSIEDIWGPAGRHLAIAVGAEPHATGRQTLIEDALVRILADTGGRRGGRTEQNASVADDAVDALVRSRGRLSVSDLCHLAECGERRLERVFREHVGVGPKRLARIMRFQAGADALRRGVGQAEAAWTCGYADQAHLLRDFRAFSGTTPRACFRGPRNTGD